MNDMTTDTATGTAIALPAPTQLAAILTSKADTNDLLARMVADGDAEFAGLSPDTVKGRKSLISLSNKASTTRAEVTRQAKALTEEWRAKTSAVNAGKKAFEDGLAEARDRWRQPVTDWEAAEEARVEMHKAALAKFNLNWADAGTSSDDVRRCLSAIEATTTGDEWDEFQPVAEARKATAISHYSIMLATAEKNEADAAELTKLRAEAEERARKDAEEAAAKAEAERLAAEQAEQKRLAAEKVEADRISAERAEAARAEAIERARAEAQEAAKKTAAEVESRHARELADALPREIARVSAKRDRWRDMAKEHPELGPGMGLTIAIMQAEIDLAIRACATGDVIEMMAALETLRGYNDDD